MFRPAVRNTQNVVPNPNPVPVPQLYPFFIKNQIDTVDLTASAVVDSIELDRRPIAAIILNFAMLGSGAAATIANALTQCGTELYVSDGGRIITPKWSAAELYEYHNHFFNRIAPFQDGTAADNKLALLSMVIPFGRPNPFMGNSITSLVDPMVGFVPKAIPRLHYSTPADGNSIDTRTMKVSVLYYDGIRPSWSKAWTDWSSITQSATSYKDWLLPDAGRLLETFMYLTSAYNDTLTADAPTLLKWRITQKGTDVLTSGEVTNILGALLDSTPTPDDDYLYLPLMKFPVDDLSYTIPLTPDTRFKTLGGVADALKAAFGIINPA
jgi:hypothetical protein